MTTESVCSADGFDPSLSGVEPSELLCDTLRQWLRSGFHALRCRLGERLCWSRGLYRERPVGQLAHLSRGQQMRVALLRRRFDVRFEEYCAALTTLKNYDYLDMLDQAWMARGEPRPTGGVVHDVGRQISGMPACSTPSFSRLD